MGRARTRPRGQGPARRPSSRSRRRPPTPTRGALLFAFAFAVMADPVSSVAYAIEAALRALHGHLGLLLLTMGLVLFIIAVVRLNYDQLIQRFPEGGGAVAATAGAFGEGPAFIPLGALIVDYVLTISISVAAAASAAIASLPSLAAWRIPVALLILVAIAALTWFGHLGRLVFAVMTSAFIAVGVAVIVQGGLSPHGRGTTPVIGTGGGVSALTVLLAFPVAMALATGVEAPSSAIAQLGQLDDPGRRRYGRSTLWLTFFIEGGFTLAITGYAVWLHVGLPRPDSTLIADVAQVAVGRGVLFLLFQLASALLLLAAASSSFQAGPGLLKALAHGTAGVEILPEPLGRTNHHHTPYWSVVVYLGVSAVVLLLAGGKEQELVLVYAVAVFVSFLCGLIAMTRFSRRQGDRFRMVVNLFGAVVVAFTLAVNVRRGYPILSLASAGLIAAVLYGLWLRAGRPGGVAHIEAEAEAEAEAGGTAGER